MPLAYYERDVCRAQASPGAMVDPEYCDDCLDRVAQEDDPVGVINQVAQLGRELSRFRDQRAA